MKKISIIAAIGKNNELGKDNDLVWHIKEDLRFYKNFTMNKYIVMGTNTYKSMPKKAFIGRKPVLLTDEDIKDDKLIVFNELKRLLEFIEKEQKEFVIVGGASIYKQFLPLADEMYLTRIFEEQDADTFFPEITGNWHIEKINDFKKETPPYIREKYTRKEK